MKIFFTDPAKKHLHEIFLYYKKYASIRVANRIKQTILARAKTLTAFPEMGQLEPLLMYLQNNHRYIVECNYKIIYYISEDTIFITDVFDTRQNPTELTKRNK